MKPELTKDFREFVELLDANGVKYVLIGGYAVAWHGHPRFTNDIDFFLERSEQNAAAILRALAQFGMGSLGVVRDDFLEGGGVFIGHEPYRIDLLTSALGIDFDEAWRTRIVGTWDGVKINVLDRDLLIRSKRAAGRPDDLGDLEKLERRGPR